MDESIIGRGGKSEKSTKMPMMSESVFVFVSLLKLFTSIVIVRYKKIGKCCHEINQHDRTSKEIVSIV